MTEKNNKVKILFTTKQKTE